MKNFFLALVLFSVLALPLTVKADIAPEPWYQPQQENTQDAPVPDANAVLEPTAVLYDDTTDEEAAAPFLDAVIDGHQAPSADAFAVSLYVTIIIECLAAAVVLAILRRPLHTLLAVPLASLITLPILWSALYTGFAAGAITQENWVVAVVIAEAVVIVIEAMILFAAHPKTLSKQHALVVSATMNIASVVVGYMLGINV